MDEGRRDLEDRRLVESYKRTREASHFAALFQRYQQRVYSICYAMCKDRGIAEDMVQETFVRAFRQIDHFNESGGDSCFEAWLCTISRHLCIGELRKLSVRRRGVPVYRTQEPPNQEDTLASAQIEQELSILPEAVRRCWLLFKLDGYRYKEIAELTGLAVKEVERSIEAAREKLKRK